MLSIENLHCSYGTAEVLRGVDLEVASGEVVALLGRNGMGKTSLVRSIAGTRPPVVSAGIVRWRDAETTQLASYEIARRGIGLVPQGRRVFGSLTVQENLTVAARGPDTDTGWGLDEVYAFFPRLAERSRSKGRNLSGGEQQMLAIGRALMTNPELLLMDEPSEGLAPVVIGQIRDRIRALGDMSVLLVEQNLGLALAVADRVYILGDDGRIGWRGRPGDLDADADAKRRHLGV